MVNNQFSRNTAKLTISLLLTKSFVSKRTALSFFMSIFAHRNIKYQRIMNNTMRLEQSVIMDVVSLMGNDSAMKRLRSVLDELTGKNGGKAETKEMTEDDKAEILNDIKEGLREMRMVKQGKLKSRPIKELINEL